MVADMVNVGMRDASDDRNASDFSLSLPSIPTFSDGDHPRPAYFPMALKGILWYINQQPLYLTDD
jgi:hypothetical protein